MPLFRPRHAPPLEQQQQQQQQQQQLRNSQNAIATASSCSASLEGLLEASSRSLSLSASGLCRCGLGGDEEHSVQVNWGGKMEREFESFFFFLRRTMSRFFPFQFHRNSIPFLSSLSPSRSCSAPTTATTRG
jgi:hypothetical protein